MDMAGLTSILAQAGAGAITQTPGHRISLEGEAAEGQSMEVSGVMCDAESIDQTDNVLCHESNMYHESLLYEIKYSSISCYSFKDLHNVTLFNWFRKTLRGFQCECNSRPW